MDIEEIINHYLQIKAENLDEAISFILKEFRGEKGDSLNRTCLALFMLNEKGDGYDPKNEKIYAVNPDCKSSDFKPKEGQFVLFKKMGGVLGGPKTASLENQGKIQWIQKLQVIGTEEILNAHIYDPNKDVMKKLMEQYKEVIEKFKVYFS